DRQFHAASQARGAGPWQETPGPATLALGATAGPLRSDRRVVQAGRSAAMADGRSVRGVAGVDPRARAALPREPSGLPRRAGDAGSLAAPRSAAGPNQLHRRAALARNGPPRCRPARPCHQPAPSEPGGTASSEAPSQIVYAAHETARRTPQGIAEIVS